MTTQQTELVEHTLAQVAPIASTAAALFYERLWVPFINNPAYPDYPSGVNSVTGAFTRTLALVFGTDQMTFDVTSTIPQVIQKTRTYTRLCQVVNDTVDARIYQGIHFRFADTWGRRVGQRAADAAVSHILRAKK